MIEYDLIATKNAFGFGHDWTLILKKGEKVKKFWLGQDVKVVSRILGMRMDYAVEYYKTKANSENFDVIRKLIARDLLKKFLDTQRLTQEQLEKVFLMNNYELSIE